MAANDTGLPPEPIRDSIDEIHIHASRIEGLVFATWLLGQEIEPFDRAGRPCSAFNALLEAIEAECAALLRAADVIVKGDKEADQ